MRNLRIEEIEMFWSCKEDNKCQKAKITLQDICIMLRTVRVERRVGSSHWSTKRINFAFSEGRRLPVSGLRLFGSMSFWEPKLFWLTLALSDSSSSSSSRRKFSPRTVCISCPKILKPKETVSKAFACQCVWMEIITYAAASVRPMDIDECVLYIRLARLATAPTSSILFITAASCSP